MTCRVDSAQSARKRGRPRRFPPPKDLRHLPLDLRLENLSPTARALLRAGRRILAERGYRGLTMEAVANEAGVGKSTLVEQFGGRAGYVGLLFDSLTQEACPALSQHRAASTTTRRIDTAAWISALSVFHEDEEASEQYIEILANAVRDEALRTRLAELLGWYREIRVRTLASCPGGDACKREALENLAAILNAAEDGLALQRNIDPHGLDLRSAMDLLGKVVSVYLREKLLGAKSAS
jgi:AcrR family transcriptional regulator